MRIGRIETACWVAGGDDDVAVPAGWEELLQIDFRIVGVVDEQQPVVTLSSQPGKCVLGGRSRRGGSSNPFQTGQDGVEGGGVDNVDIPEPR